MSKPASRLDTMSAWKISCGSPTTRISHRLIPTPGSSSSDLYKVCPRMSARRCCIKMRKRCTGFNDLLITGPPREEHPHGLRVTKKCQENNHLGAKPTADEI